MKEIEMLKYRSLWLVTALMMATLIARAQDAAPRMALIVGVSQYGYPAASELKGVVKDMESATKIALAMGIPQEKIQYLRNEQATKENIMNALSSLSHNGADGRAFIYFSGHGTRYYSQTAKGCTEGLLSYEGQVISHAEFAGAIRELSQSSDKVITMFDACHSEGVLLPQGTRSLRNDLTVMTPKFTLKTDDDSDVCAKPVNYKTRSLTDETTRLGAIQENFVQISSAKSNEVSFDDAKTGGLATQGMRDCMLGQAKDLNGSGAVSLDEIRQCAQNFIDKRLENSPNVSPSHITVSGNRNLIPVHRLPPPEEVSAEVPHSTQVEDHPAIALEIQAHGAGDDKAKMSLATLKDIESQRNPKRVVDVRLSKTALKIGTDALQLTVKSNHDGYLYLILLGSDAQSFYVLFPNGLDAHNQIKAGQSMVLPRSDWLIKANGPEGVDHILVMVADNPRKLDGLSLASPTDAEPFTFALNHIGGRSALIEFLTGIGNHGVSDSFGAKIVSVKEIK